MPADPTILDENGQISLRKALGKNYEDVFYDHEHRYIMIRGAKGSKKTFNIAQILIYRIMAYPMSNAVVFRKAYSSLKDSSYTDLLKAISRFGVDDLWDAYTSPLRLVYKPTGQSILFRGLDKAEKLGGLTVPVGYMCWEWIDEFSEITSQDDFTKLDMGIRGEIPEEYGLWKQIICTFNPWSEHAWFKKEFFDPIRDDTYCKVVTYKDNEFLGADDIKQYEMLYERSPRLARIICDGEWGIAEGLIYENWEVAYFDVEEIRKRPGIREVYGLDFGFAKSPTAFVGALADPVTREIWIYEDSIYDTGMTLKDLARRLTLLGYADKEIIADSASPLNIEELRKGQLMEDPDDPEKVVKYVIPSVRSCFKSNKHSVKNGILRLQAYKIWVLPTNKNAIAELSCYCYATDKDGNTLEEPEKVNDHLLDALRYGCEPFLMSGGGRVAEMGTEPAPRVELEGIPVHNGMSVGRSVTADGRPIYTLSRKTSRVAASRRRLD